MGDNPENFVTVDGYQAIADELGMAVVGVSGTRPKGKRKFVWSEDTVEDAAQVRRALAELRGRLTVAPGQMVAFGFSQGAQMAFQIALALPTEYRGAIALSPGTPHPINRDGLRPSAGNRKQGFVCVCGAEEHPTTLEFARSDARLAREAGSRVELKLYDGVAEHRFPDDFHEAFPRWVRFVRGERAPK